MTLLHALIGHLVGDFLLQNDALALNKKSSGPNCATHCVIWATSVCLFASWGMIPWLLLLAMRYAQDRTQVIAWCMKAVGQEEFASGPCAPWSSIVVDQVWHILQIYAVARWIA